MNSTTNPKSLAIVALTLNIGGTEKHLALILPELVKRGWEVTVLVLHDGGLLIPELQQQGVTVIPILDTNSTYAKLTKCLPRFVASALSIPTHILLLAKQLRKFPQDTILHFFLPRPYILGMFSAMLARFNGHKIMSRRSLNHYQRRIPGVAWLEKKLHKNIAIAAGNSQAVVDQLIAEGLRSSRVRLIYNSLPKNFVSGKSCRAAIRHQLNITENTVVLIIVANLIPYKGHLDLLQALYNIKRSMPAEWCLLCVGRDDGIGENLKLAAEKFGLSKHIFWLGSRADVADLLAAADIGILCSHEEGFANAILEGMAASLPMVVTDVGGNKEAVADGKTGLVVAPKNPTALGNAILRLASDLSLARNFGLAGKQRVHELFSLDACVQNYLKLYADVKSAS